MNFPENYRKLYRAYNIMKIRDVEIGIQLLDEN